MPGHHEVSPSDFIAAAGLLGESYGLYAQVQQLEAAFAADFTSEVLDVEAQVARLNQFVVESTLLRQSQQELLAFRRVWMTPTEFAATEVELARSSGTNTAVLGAAWESLKNRGFPLKTRHPKTREAEYVFDIGMDSQRTYQTKVRGHEEPWDLIYGNQLHL